jgi:predicted RNA-binding Zn-ribbon protein involved in translation (DUF1610 family)
MINHSTSIPCPVCKTSIPLEVKALLNGTKFACPQCFAMIGIEQDSVEIARVAIEKFDELKSEFKSKQ